MGLVRFASGAAATITNSVNCPRQETYVRFDLQRATIEGRFLYGFDTTDWRIEPGEVAVDPETLDAWRRFPPNRRADHKAQLDVLLDDMRAGRRPLTSGDQARATIELLSAAVQSGDIGGNGASGVDRTRRPVPRAGLRPGRGSPGVTRSAIVARSPAMHPGG